MNCMQNYAFLFMCSNKIRRTGWERALTVMKYGQEWKEHRRMFTKYFRPGAIPRYHSRIRVEAGRFLLSILDSPNDYYSHIRL